MCGHGKQHHGDCGCHGGRHEEHHEECECDCGCHAEHECECGCHEGGCGEHQGRGECECNCHEGSETTGIHFERRFTTRAERIAQLEAYLKDLQTEAKAVEERIAELKAVGA
jgi:hypothetical protein